MTSVTAVPRTNRIAVAQTRVQNTPSNWTLRYQMASVQNSMTPVPNSSTTRQDQHHDPEAAGQRVRRRGRWSPGSGSAPPGAEPLGARRGAEWVVGIVHVRRSLPRGPGIPRRAALRATRRVSPWQSRPGSARGSAAAEPVHRAPEGGEDLVRERVREHRRGTRWLPSESGADREWAAPGSLGIVGRDHQTRGGSRDARHPRGSGPRGLPPATDPAAPAAARVAGRRMAPRPGS